MILRPIKTVANLCDYLQTAIKLEHATIPPYLLALYSLRPGTNAAAYQQIRTVAIEEMLHLTLAANVLNAIGGTPNLTQADFVPKYPAYLPNGETDFQVNLQSFSKETLENFLQIERPARPVSNATRMIARPTIAAGVQGETFAEGTRILPTVQVDDGPALHFWSIGEFYAEICRGMTYLETEAMGRNQTIFVGDAKRQITPEYYYSGGGTLTPVTNLKTAQEALRLISEQGEGYDGGIFDHEGELSHYYRFEQLKLGRSYVPKNTPGNPSGEELKVDWDGVYRVKTNACLSDYPKDSELYNAVLDFRTTYQDLLACITQALTGQPELLNPAVGDMFKLKEKFYRLMHNPMPGHDGLNAAPVFGPIS
ncbi:MAG TPA: ferritin-like protein [Gemmataceae bacterium]|nr:ferritin-like protein [Gemmataceae bacterium]